MNCVILAHLCASMALAMASSAASGVGPMEEFDLNPDMQKVLDLNGEIRLVDISGSRQAVPWVLYKYTDNEADGTYPTLASGMLAPIIDEQAIRGLWLSGSADDRCEGCPKRFVYTDEILQDLPKITHLEHLYLQEVDLRNAERWKFLRPLEKLKSLALVDCAVNLKDMMTVLGSHPELVSLKIRQSGQLPFQENPTGKLVFETVEQEDVLTLVQSCPKLQVFSFSGFHSCSMQRFSEQALLGFSRFPNLNELTLPHLCGYYQPNWSERQLEYRQDVLRRLADALPTVSSKKLSIDGPILDMEGSNLPQVKQDR